MLASVGINDKIANLRMFPKSTHLTSSFLHSTAHSFLFLVNLIRQVSKSLLELFHITAHVQESVIMVDIWILSVQNSKLWARAEQTLWDLCSALWSISLSQRYKQP